MGTKSMNSEWMDKPFPRGCAANGTRTNWHQWLLIGWQIRARDVRLNNRRTGNKTMKDCKAETAKAHQPSEGVGCEGYKRDARENMRRQQGWTGGGWE
jgi:hypothetical protein